MEPYIITALGVLAVLCITLVVIVLGLKRALAAVQARQDEMQNAFVAKLDAASHTSHSMASDLATSMSSALSEMLRQLENSIETKGEVTVTHFKEAERTAKGSSEMLTNELEDIRKILLQIEKDLFGKLSSLGTDQKAMLDGFARSLTTTVNDRVNDLIQKLDEPVSI